MDDISAAVGGWSFKEKCQYCMVKQSAGFGKCNTYQDVVDEDEDCFFGRELDPLADDVHELPHGQVRGHQVLLLVQVGNVALLGFLDDDLPGLRWGGRGESGAEGDAKKKSLQKRKEKKRTRGTTSLVFGVGHEKPRFGRFEFERGVAFPYRDPLGVLRADALRFRLTFVCGTWGGWRGDQEWVRV